MKLSKVFCNVIIPTTQLSSLSTAFDKSYSLIQEYSGEGFFNNFDFVHYELPDHDSTWSWGNYVPRTEAQSKELVYTSPKSASAFMHVDSHMRLEFNGHYRLPRRDTIRIESKNSYTHGLFVFDIAHIPTGCATWPALWLLGSGKWPHKGEIDVIEGVHLSDNNGIAMHTTKDCRSHPLGDMEMCGTRMSSNCDSEAPKWEQHLNQGCSVEDPRDNSFGAGFNANGGGHYAMQWASEGIKIWFFPRGTEPEDIHSERPRPEGWGAPVSILTNRRCNIDTHFDNMRIVVNTALCGDWAGNEDVWANSGCGKLADSCEEFVARNPQAFKEAYWEIRGMRIFQELEKSRG
ncbi:hypothetical protein BJ508DRAFT_338940 [Ascobolus immersus RN42]|uniref:GH16 domain-containing protein n=1 Tax=Ascobolus immersus RN42 TaxID=1160509 RepID=A0A3N4IHT5_ASCIM|nr:hypothetical protein BJ508DRAFT_338940 [Ascobolus immersus RN42]